MKRTDIKSRCPVNFTTEILGDPWSMLILREIVNLGPRTFGDLLRIKERIGTSVLADRLARLEEKGVLTKAAHPTDKRKPLYKLTDAGLDLLPILYEVAMWGSRHNPSLEASSAWFAAMRLDRTIVLAAWRKALQAGSSFLDGPVSVAQQLNLPQSSPRV